MKKSDWISVTNAIPAEHAEAKGLSSHVLVSDGNTRWVAFYDFNSSEWELAHGTLTKGMENLKPTHWMPLPKNP